MRYFLDFDRTIFDTEAFKKSIATRPTFSQLGQQLREVFIELFDTSSASSKRKSLRRIIGTYLSHQRFLFMPHELKKFLYPEVPEFLRKNGGTCTIVTYGVQSFIMAKVTSALSDFPIDEIVYTRTKKGRTLRKLCEKVEGPYLYVDDAHFQLESVSKKCPNVQIYEIRRDSLPADGRWPVIHSLTEI